MRRAVFLLILFALALAAPSARSQMPMMGIGAGSFGGSGVAPTACTNQLVLDYSNSCALIGQAWGQ